MTQLAEDNGGVVDKGQDKYKGTRENNGTGETIDRDILRYGLVYLRPTVAARHRIHYSKNLLSLIDTAPIV
jgi:hypothetical protein